MNYEDVIFFFIKKKKNFLLSAAMEHVMVDYCPNVIMVVSMPTLCLFWGLSQEEYGGIVGGASFNCRFLHSNLRRIT